MSEDNKNNDLTKEVENKIKDTMQPALDEQGKAIASTKSQVNSLEDTMKKLIEVSTKSQEVLTEVLKSNEEAKKYQGKKGRQISTAGVLDISEGNEASLSDETVEMVKSRFDTFDSNFSVNGSANAVIFSTKSKEPNETNQKIFNDFASSIQNRQIVKNKSNVYNTFNDAQGGFAQPLPIFGGLFDTNVLVSSGAFSLCNKFPLGNVMQGSTDLTKYDMQILSMVGTPEGVGMTDSELVKLQNENVHLVEKTHKLKLTRQSYYTHINNQGRFNLINLHNRALDSMAAKYLDSMFWTGDGKNDNGILADIESGRIETITTNTQYKLEFSDIIDTVLQLKSVYRSNGAVPVYIQAKALSELINEKAGGSEEYMNQLYFAQLNGEGIIRIASNVAMKLIVMDNSTLINPNSKAEFKTFENLIGGGASGDANKVVALIGVFDKACTYLTSTAMEMGFTAITDQTLDSNLRTMYKTMNAGFTCVVPEAMKALKIKA